MSIQACAELIRKGDPDRFFAAMAAPPDARAVLFPLYAFNLEVARAPWVTNEPIIAEMRVQWWRDVLEEIVGDGPVRRHEVALPLADVLSPETAGILMALVEARRKDAQREDVETIEKLRAYLNATAGSLMWAAAMSLGAEPEAETDIRALALAAGLARYFEALPKIVANGRSSVSEADAQVMVDFAGEVLETLPRIAALRQSSGAGRPALIEAWMAEPVLRQAVSDPRRVLSGGLGVSPFRKRLRLLRWS